MAKLGQAGVRAIVVLAISEVVLFFNVGKNMSASQITLTTDLILEQYWYLTVEELKACFRKAMRTAKVYDRLDGNIILGWLNEYDQERDEIIERINIEESNRLRNGKTENSRTGASYDEYVSSIKARVEAGDKEAVELLKDIELFESRIKSSEKRMTRAEFKRRYVTEYLHKNKPTT